MKLLLLMMLLSAPAIAQDENAMLAELKDIRENYVVKLFLAKHPENERALEDIELSLDRSLKRYYELERQASNARKRNAINSVMALDPVMRGTSIPPDGSAGALELQAVDELATAKERLVQLLRAWRDTQAMAQAEPTLQKPAEHQPRQNKHR